MSVRGMDGRTNSDGVRQGAVCPIAQHRWPRTELSPTSHTAAMGQDRRLPYPNSTLPPPHHILARRIWFSSAVLQWPAALTAHSLGAEGGKSHRQKALDVGEGNQAPKDPRRRRGRHAAPPTAILSKVNFYPLKAGSTKNGKSYTRDHVTPETFLCVRTRQGMSPDASPTRGERVLEFRYP